MSVISRVNISVPLIFSLHILCHVCMFKWIYLTRGMIKPRSFCIRVLLHLVTRKWLCGYTCKQASDILVKHQTYNFTTQMCRKTFKPQMVSSCLSICHVDLFLVKHKQTFSSFLLLAQSVVHKSRVVILIISQVTFLENLTHQEAEERTMWRGYVACNVHCVSWYFAAHQKCHISHSLLHMFMSCNSVQAHMSHHKSQFWKIASRWKMRNSEMTVSFYLVSHICSTCNFKSVSL